MSGKGTKNNDICHRVTADTVAAMDPADHFARSKCPRQHVVVAVQHAGFGVDGHTAHGVVYARRNLNGVERPFVDGRTQRGGATKIIVVLFFNKAVVALQRCQELVIIHTQRFRQGFRRAGAGHEAFCDVLICGFVFSTDMLVKDDVRVFFRQRDD